MYANFDSYTYTQKQAITLRKFNKILRKEIQRLILGEQLRLRVELRQSLKQVHQPVQLQHTDAPKRVKHASRHLHKQPPFEKLIFHSQRLFLLCADHLPHVFIHSKQVSRHQFQEKFVVAGPVGLSPEV